MINDSWWLKYVPIFHFEQAPKWKILSQHRVGGDFIVYMLLAEANTNIVTDVIFYIRASAKANTGCILPSFLHFLGFL